MSLGDNTKKLYLKMYPNMSIEQIEIEITKFDKHSLEEGISLESSNRHKYLRGWLMQANFRKNNKVEGRMNDCCKHLHREAIKELGFKDKRIIELEKEVTRLFEPTRELWNNETREELAKLKEENEMMRIKMDNGTMPKHLKNKRIMKGEELKDFGYTKIYVESRNLDIPQLKRHAWSVTFKGSHIKTMDTLKEVKAFIYEKQTKKKEVKPERMVRKTPVYVIGINGFRVRQKRNK